MRKPAVYLIPITLMIAGVVLLAMFTVSNQKASASDHWSQAIGTISAGAGPGSAVQFRYAALGKDYSGTSTEHRRAYKSGERLIVYFDPANPADATLELGRRPSNWTWVIGTFALVLGIVLALFFARAPAGPGIPRRKNNHNKTQPGKKTASRPMQRLRPPPGIDRNK